jgi:O-antigen/teichoic acid export membrane protein
LIVIWSGLGIALFCQEIIILFARNPDYWGGYIVVPWIVLAYVFSGARDVVNLGLMLKGKTKQIATFTLLSTGLNIGLNFLLIPIWKITGAAIATVLSFMCLFSCTYYASNKQVPIPYEKIKLIKMLMVGIGLFLASLIFTNMESLHHIVIKGFLFISYPFILYLMKLYDRVELQTLKKILNKYIG